MFRSLLGLVIAISVFASIGCDDRNLLAKVLEEVETEFEPSHLQLLREAIYDELGDVDIKQFYQAWKARHHDNLTCHQCHELFVKGKAMWKSPDTLVTFGKSLCNKLKLQTERVCEGLVERWGPAIQYILQNTKLDDYEFCAALIHPDCMTHMGRKMTDKILWEIPLPAKVEFEPKPGSPTKMMHLTDLHFDLFYTEGSSSQCGEPLCCRATSPGNKHKAGVWGETYGVCDTPPDAGRKFIAQIAEKHPNTDFIVWTGDSIAHDVWNTSIPVNLETIKMISELYLKEFGNITVVPALGNHEAHPINLYIPSEVPKESNLSMSWLYDTLADDYWSHWIPEKSRVTFKIGGYYSRLVRPNLKVIALNTNACDLESYWIAYNPVDIDGQLKWLVDELQHSETNGINTVLIGHEPPSNCYLAWFNNYLRITERFQDVIVGNYYGHTHKEEIYVYYQKNMTTNQTYPVNHIYVGGSITTYAELNPNYNIFELDQNGRIEDYTTYFTDLAEDNARGRSADPVWRTLYSAKSAYGLKDLSLKSWDQFITRAKTDDKLTKEYYNNYHRNSTAYVKSHPNDTLAVQRKILQDRKILNRLYTMLPPITN